MKLFPPLISDIISNKFAGDPTAFTTSLTQYIFTFYPALSHYKNFHINSIQNHFSSVTIYIIFYSYDDYSSQNPSDMIYSDSITIVFNSFVIWNRDNCLNSILSNG